MPQCKLVHPTWDGASGRLYFRILYHLDAIGISTRHDMHDTAPYGVYGDASIRIGGPTAATSASFQSLRHSIMSSYH